MQLEQVFRHLLANALACRSDRPLRISVTADREEILALGIDAAVAPTASGEEIVATFQALADRRRAAA